MMKDTTYSIEFNRHESPWNHMESWSSSNQTYQWTTNPSSLIFALNKPPKMGGFPSYQLSKPAENQETNYYASLWIINTLLET